jgi:hypothetical protein
MKLFPPNFAIPWGTIVVGLMIYVMFLIFYWGECVLNPTSSESMLDAPAVLMPCPARVYSESAVLNYDGEVVAVVHQGQLIDVTGKTMDGRFWHISENGIVGFVVVDAVVSEDYVCTAQLELTTSVLPPVHPFVLTPPG